MHAAAVPDELAPLGASISNALGKVIVIEPNWIESLKKQLTCT